MDLTGLGSRLHCISSMFIEFYWILLGFTGCYWVLPGLSRATGVDLGFIGF